MTRTDQWDGDDPADRLDNELDRMVRGERPETGAVRSGFGPTIEEVFALASTAGMGAERSAASTRQLPSPTHERRSIRPHPDRIRRFPMSVTSTAAIVAIVIAITFSTFQSLGTDPSPSTESPLAASTQASPVATPTGDLIVAPARRLTTEDCSVEPMTREELIDILGAFPGALGRPGPEKSLDQMTLESLQETLYAYQTCLLLGSTFQWTALESAPSLRARVYADGQTTPYSPTTLSEIVRGWEEVDASRASAPEFAADAPVWVLDPYAESEASAVVTDSFIQIPVSQVYPDGSKVNQGLMQPIVQFVLEDGEWRIYQYPDVLGG